MAKLYKDFNKDVKDLLNKNYEKPGFWKIDHKNKCTEDKTWFINPKADSDKGVWCELDFNDKEHDIKTKTTVRADRISPKITWTGCKEAPMKIDVSVDRLATDAAYEVEYTGEYKEFKLHNVLTKNKDTIGVSFKAADNMQVGIGAVIGLANGAKLDQWNAAVLYTEKGRTAVVSTVNAKAFSAGLMFPVDVKDKTLQFAAQIDSCQDRKLAVTVGTELPCPIECLSKDKMKIKANWANDQITPSMAFVKKLNDKWSSAISMSCKGCNLDGGLKLGVIFTCE